MRPDGVGGGWQARWLRRLALAACQPADRPWVNALFRELSVIDGAKPRALWMLGATHFVLTGSRERGAALLTNRLHIAIPLAFCAAVLSAAVSQAGYEGLGADDDLFLGLALALGATLVGLAALARNSYSKGRARR